MKITLTKYSKVRFRRNISNIRVQVHSPGTGARRHHGRGRHQQEPQHPARAQAHAGHTGRAVRGRYRHEEVH